MKPIVWRNQGPLAFWNDEDWMNEFLGRGVSRLPEVFQRPGFPAVSLSDSGTEFVATFDVPGLAEPDLEIKVVADQLVVTGERKWQDEKKEKECYRSESQYGSFERAIPLPEGLNLDPKLMVARLEKGVLEVRIPKLAPKPAARIKIESKK